MAQESEHRGQLQDSQTFDVGRWKPPAQGNTEEITSTTSQSETAPFLPTKGLAQCAVSKWYGDLRRTNPISTQIDKLQVRSTNPYLNKVTHRFVVLYMRDKTVHRLDRRASDQNDPFLISGLSFPARGRVTTTDELTSNVDPERLKKGTYLEIEIALEGMVDLWVVLSTCHAISRDPDGQTYDLREHNCFFFSWSILMVASRYYLHIKTPTQAELMDRLEKEHLSVLTKFIVGKAVDTFRDLVLAAVSVFREKEQESSKEGEDIRKGMSYLARVVWGLPQGFLGSYGRMLLDARLPSNLRKTLEVHVETVVRERAPMIYDQVLRSIDMQLELGKPLWVNDLREVIRPQVQKAVIDLLWPAIIEAITQGFGSDVDAAELAEKVYKDLTQSWWRHVGTRTIQLGAVLTAALHGGLVNVRKEADEETQGRIRKEARESTTGDPGAELTKLNADMFDLAWESARNGALDSVEKAAKRTTPLLRPKHREARDHMWNTVAGVWTECWNTACDRARGSALDALDAIMKEVLETSAQLVLEELGSGKTQPTVGVHAPKNLMNLEVLTLDVLQSGWKGFTTSLQLQKHMQRVMQKAKFGRPDDVQVTMTRIWVQVRELGIEFEKILAGEPAEY